MKKTTEIFQRVVAKTAKWAVPCCLLFLPLNMQAQEVFEEDEEEDDVEEVVNENDEITLTDAAGNEEVIDFPAAMTYDLDSLMNIYMSKTYLGQDEDCRMKDENPTYTREEYIDRLYRLPTVIEMPYNEVVQTFIDRYAGRLRHSVSYLLGASNFYMPIFEQALETYGLPLELKYVPIIESALNPKAVSRAGAAGLWQFMPATARQYGMTLNSLVDDRCDPIKGSDAAARLLRDLYKVFGDWHLVIAAYNCGPENINKAIHRAGGERDYWKIYPYLPRETRGYVPAFIAANYIMNYYCDHNICPMRSRLPEKTDTLMVSENVHLKQIAAVLDLDIDLLRALNPSYRRDIVPGATEQSILRLPLADVGRFIDNQDSIYNYHAQELMGKRMEVEIAANVALPAYKSKSRTVKGRKGKATRSSKRATRNSRKRGGGAQNITVRSGQTLSEIARRNGTTVAKLKKLNGLKGSNIRAGKKLRVK
jgi:membrane-bound lytic murein transglycosylase D